MLWQGWTLHLAKEARRKTPRIIWFHVYEKAGTGTSIETESRLVVAGTREEEWEVTANVLKLGSGDGCSTLWIY